MFVKEEMYTASNRYPSFRVLVQVEGSTDALESFTLLPVMLARTLNSRTNDNVELEIKLHVRPEIIG